MSSQKGYTLTELIVVTVFLTMLALLVSAVVGIWVWILT